MLRVIGDIIISVLAVYGLYTLMHDLVDVIDMIAHKRAEKGTAEKRGPGDAGQKEKDVNTAKQGRDSEGYARRRRDDDS